VRAIRLRYAGAEGLTLGRDRALLIHIALGVLRDARPLSFSASTAGA